MESLASSTTWSRYILSPSSLRLCVISLRLCVKLFNSHSLMNDPISPPDDPALMLNRRHFFSRTSLGIGSMALGSLLGDSVRAGTVDIEHRGVLAAPHFPPRAKRVIYLFMSGGPSQLDL